MGEYVVRKDVYVWFVRTCMYGLWRENSPPRARHACVTRMGVLEPWEKTGGCRGRYRWSFRAIGELRPELEAREQFRFFFAVASTSEFARTVPHARRGVASYRLRSRQRGKPAPTPTRRMTSP